MKNVELTLKKTTTTAIYAMASSVLTDILLNFLLDSTYVGQYEDGQIRIVTQGNFATWQIVLLTLGIFIAFWVLLGNIVPRLLSVLSRLSYRPFKKHRREEVVETYKHVRDDAMRIAEILSTESFAIQWQKPFLFVDLVKDVKRLTDVFLTTGRKRNLFKRSYFRTGSTIDDIENYISAYEISAMIDFLEELLNQTYHSEHVEMTDLDNAKKRLHELKEGFGL